MTVFRGAGALLLCASSLAWAQPVPAPGASPLGVWVGGDFLLDANAGGASLVAGLRYQPFAHFSVSFDVGYGLLAGPPGVEDRWWAIPSVAFVNRLGPTTFDCGAGFGVGTVSAYSSLSSYVAQPFDPTSHTTAPALRLHAMVIVPRTPGLDLFARLEVATLLASGSSWSDALWAGVSLGVQFHLLSP
jgi:hypothetical protein